MIGDFPMFIISPLVLSQVYARIREKHENAIGPLICLSLLY